MATPPSNSTNQRGKRQRERRLPYDSKTTGLACPNIRVDRGLRCDAQGYTGGPKAPKTSARRSSGAIVTLQWAYGNYGLRLPARRAYVKAGRMFIPFGLRIEDDSAFIRQVSGVNFNSSDDGVEGGLELGPWSASVSVTNGAGGGAETNRGKLISGVANYVQPSWRVGVSGSVNLNGSADRRMQSVFGGLRTGIVSWLASVVNVVDDATPIGRLRQWASLVEGNVEVAKGHNLKLTYEYHDPNTHVREDHRARYSAVWEYMPLRYTQFRLGARKNDGIPQNNAQNASEVFLQWHAFF
jgi:hypothetical protein